MRWYHPKPVLGLLIVLVAGLTGCATTDDVPDAADRAKRAVGLYKAGVKLFTGGNVDGGIEKLEEAMGFEPTYTKLRYDLGRMQLFRATRTDTKGLVARAEADQLASSGNASGSKRKRFESNTLREAAQQDFSNSRLNFEFARSRLDPEELPNLHYFLAQVYVGLNRYTEALEHFDRGTELANDRNMRPNIDDGRLREMRKLLADGAEYQDRNR